MEKLKDGTRPAFRVVHESNLLVYLARGALHAARHAPDDGLAWTATHNEKVQGRRATARVPVGPGGVMLDYIPFHFGPKNIFLYNLHTNYVSDLDYREGQGPLLTLVVSVEGIASRGHRFVFYDGHALHAFSTAYADLNELVRLEWEIIHGDRWSNQEPHRKRCKQAEFMVYRELPWEEIVGIGVCDAAAKVRVETIVDRYAPAHRPPVAVTPSWYFEASS